MKKGEILAGKYRVEQVIGVGGMGVVASALHLELGTLVAIKLLLCGAEGSDEAIERFSREARAASRLRGEHAVRVFDVGKHSDGTPYMVLEYLVGYDLDTLLTELGALDVSTAVGYVLQACEAIAEAHSLGIIHRDLKPKNLFLTKRVDGSPLVKVLDFGIAKRSQAEIGGSLTGPLAVGSPAYMSPEQMRALATLDTRADIWSLGVCLYELMTGVLPFVGNSALETCTLVLRDDPRPPADRRAEISDELSRVVMRCLRKNPAERFRDVGALAKALEPFAPASHRGAASRTRDVLQTLGAPPGGPSGVPSGVPIVCFDADDHKEPAVVSGEHTRLRRRLPFAIAAAALGLGFAVAVWFLARTPGERTTTSPAAAPVAEAIPAHSPSVPLPVSAPAPVVEAAASAALERAVLRPRGRAAKASKAVRATSADSPIVAMANAASPSASTGAGDPPPSTPGLEPPVLASPHPVAMSTGASLPAPPPFELESARVQIGFPTSVVGTTASNISRALARLGPRMTSCYREALPRMSAPFDGTGTLHVETDEEGVIAVARMAGPVAIGVAPCIVAVARGFKIPSVDTGRVIADVPLLFKAR